MKLVKQASLWFQEGVSDKIYEVDLCEVGTGKFVVNFRYGRRGANLKDGTKTTLPITESEALKIYNQLVGSKTKDGYQEVSTFGGITTQPIDFQAVTTPVETDLVNEGAPQYFGDLQLTKLEKYVLDCLKEAVKPQGMAKKDVKWSLSRIIWRVGELRLRTAVPTLISTIPQSQPLQQYSIAWALGRCGDTLAIPTLRQLSKAAASKDYVKRIALVSLFELSEGDDLLKLQADILSDLPPALSETLVANNSEGFTKTFAALPQNNEFPKILEKLYILSKYFDFTQKPLQNALKTLVFKGNNHFRAVRHIYKIAEFRDDFDMLGLLAYRIETTKGTFSSQSYFAEVDGDYLYDLQKELKKPDSKLGYSAETRGYLRRRNWRILRKLGDSEKYENYTALAVAHLLQFSDSDMTEGRTMTQTNWTWNVSTRNYDSITTDTGFKSSAHFLSFNKIMFGNSERFELVSSGKAFKLKEGKQENVDTNTREEAYKNAWDLDPKAFLRLLKESLCHPVHQFTVKGIRANDKALATVSIEDLKAMLRAPYQETVDLCIELAEKRFNPQSPDLALVAAFLECPILNARTLARNWVNQNPRFYQDKTAFIIEIFASKHRDNFYFLAHYLNQHPLNISDSKTVIEGVLTPFLSKYNTFSSEDFEEHVKDLTKDERLGWVIEVFLEAFKAPLSEIHLDITRILLEKPFPMLQTLGARIILNHKTPATELPEGLIAALVNSKVQSVREAGVQIFAKLPDDTLYRSEETLKSFCLSPYPEIRAAIRPTIKHLADKKPPFGAHWVDEMMPYFRMSEPYEGLHTDLYTLFTESLSAHLGHLGTETALKLLQSSLEPRQMLGLHLLQNNVDATELTMRQITRLADHEILSVREWAQQFYAQNLPRIKYEAPEALRILDAKWDDARQYFFDFFRTHFTEADWTPELLVFVCDSTRTDVQQFGKEMITKFFKTENGETYLMQLSQHPSVNLQNFATHYLDQFATDNPAYIEKLEHYFVTILSQVNRSGVAKARIFHFLQEEGLKNEQIATMIARIMSRQSATMAVADKAACLRVMAALKGKYPGMEMAMVVTEFRKYQKAT
jgi:predicted DNA-binding WGR domain protein